MAVDYKNAIEFIKDFKGTLKTSGIETSTQIPIYQMLNWLTGYASNMTVFEKKGKTDATIHS